MRVLSDGYIYKRQTKVGMVVCTTKYIVKFKLAGGLPVTVDLDFWSLDQVNDWLNTREETLNKLPIIPWT